MGPKEFALRTGKPEKTIIAVMNGKSSIMPDMALLFESVTKIPADFWLRLQRSYDEFIAREKRQQVIDKAVAWAKRFPVADMIKKEWLSPVESWQEKANEMLAFFGFANHGAWEDYYFKQQLKVAFRISLAHTNEAYAISAWLRKGELDAALLSARPYNEKRFRESLLELRSVMASQPIDYFQQLQSICLHAGVKVVHTPCINKAPICGSTRWLGDTPFIQLSGRYKRNDSFWFTFFHEAGHILLHGKKDIFLENVVYSDKEQLKEEEANDFARKWTLSLDQEAELLSALPLQESEVPLYATKFNTHPAIIVGRLQHLKKVSYSFGTQYIVPVSFE